MSAIDRNCPYSFDAIDHQAVDEALAAALIHSTAQHFEHLKGKKVWLACSGGRDSLALAAICAQLYRQGRLPFLPQLLHVNHNLQAVSRAWATHVQDWAAAQNLTCRVLSIRFEGNDEQSARQARYQALSAAINQDDVILLAHHADDQAETLLLRLINGAGVTGLSGIQPWRQVAKGSACYHLWRPWLGVRREQISNYAVALNLPYVDDPTNTSGDNARSHLRNEVLPKLTALNPKAVTNIAKSAELLAAAKTSLDEQIAQNYQYCQSSFHNKSLNVAPLQRVLDRDKLNQLPSSQRGQLVHFWLGLDEPLPPPKRLVDDVLLLALRADNNHESKLEWQATAQNYVIFRYRQHLFRLSQDFLSALQQPILPNIIYPKLPSQKTILLLKIATYHWQLELSKEVKEYLQHHNLGLDIRPLNRDEKLILAPNATPKSGKKLFQALGIPVWLRDSLVMISFIDSQKTRYPVQLCSIYQDWALYNSQDALLKLEQKEQVRLVIQSRFGHDN